MPEASWTIELPTRSHRIDVSYGYWFSRATVKVDGRSVLRGRPLLQMGYDRGVDLPLAIDGHHVLVQIRPDMVGLMFVSGYHFGLRVDGITVPGTVPIPPITRSGPLGPRLIEGAAWATGGGAVIGLSQHGANPFAVAYLIAPAVCSLLVRRSGLSTRWLAIACGAILVAGMLGTAVLGVVLRK
jgi:hypothetical protein